MRIVKSLKEVYECPNCGAKDYFVHNHTTMNRECLFCAKCHEEIYENEFTIDMEEARDHAFNIGKASKAPDDIDDTLMEIEYELGTYEMMASTQHELLMANCMRGILEKFISVIRRMK
jgi:transcription initiation factor TFIIIB Brf1 subunit/transcription initiation factor TFIIB